MMSIVLLLSTLLSAAGSLKFDVPQGWVSKPPASSMRVAEFSLPKAAGDAEDAAATIYFFGAGQGGTVEANLTRWMDQMAQPDGAPSKNVAKTTTLTAHSLTITVVDVPGTYTAEMSPGSADHFNKPNFRLKAAVVETPGGLYYVKVTGPQKTIARWDESLTTFLKSLRFE